MKLIPRHDEPYEDLNRDRRLVEKLKYLTITRTYISFVVSVVTQFILYPFDSHWDVVVHILRYIKRHF